MEIGSPHSTFPNEEWYLPTNKEVMYRSSYSYGSIDQLALYHMHRLQDFKLEFNLMNRPIESKIWTAIYIVYIVFFSTLLSLSHVFDDGCGQVS